MTSEATVFGWEDMSWKESNVQISIWRRDSHTLALNCKTNPWLLDHQGSRHVCNKVWNASLRLTDHLPSQQIQATFPLMSGYYWHVTFNPVLHGVATALFSSIELRGCSASTSLLESLPLSSHRLLALELLWDTDIALDGSVLRGWAEMIQNCMTVRDVIPNTCKYNVKILTVQQKLW